MIFPPKMTHAPVISAAPEALGFTTSPFFQALPVILHKEVASYFQACEALTVGATEQRMQTLYPASITHMVVYPQLFFDYTEQEPLNARDWKAYLDCHGGHLGRLLARLPCLKVLTAYMKQREVVEQALFSQPCPQLVDLVTEHFDSDNPQDLIPHQFPGENFGAHYPLYLAMARGRLPSWNKLCIDCSAHLPILTQALQAGHLNHGKELDIWECNYHSRSLLEAFKISKGKLEAVTFEVPDDLTTRRAMHELLSSPVCSERSKLEMTPNVGTDEHKSAIRFVSEYLRSAGPVGWPFLRELDLEWIESDDVLCLADALLHGGGPAPNLEGIIFHSYGDDFVNLAQLGSHLFARGALATITTIGFVGIYFRGAVMTDLMNGYERSGHNGRAIRRLIFADCTTVYDENDKLIVDDVVDVSLALIAGLGAGVSRTCKSC